MRFGFIGLTIFGTTPFQNSEHFRNTLERVYLSINNSEDPISITVIVSGIWPRKVSHLLVQSPNLRHGQTFNSYYWQWHVTAACSTKTLSSCSPFNRITLSNHLCTIPTPGYAERGTDRCYQRFFPICWHSSHLGLRTTFVLWARRRAGLFNLDTCATLTPTYYNGEHLCIRILTSWTWLLDLLGFRQYQVLVTCSWYLSEKLTFINDHRLGATNDLDDALGTHSKGEVINAFAAGLDGDFFMCTDKHILCSCYAKDGSTPIDADDWQTILLLKKTLYQMLYAHLAVLASTIRY